jgi:eukaryotic-like serine/threonine-protein kinase
MSLTPGSRVGPYDIVAPLGSGGMGEVYRARDPRLQRDVAIKVLPPSFSVDPERLRRFEQEARAAAALNHPNVLAVFDIGTENGSPYIVSELLEGETLRARLNKGPARSSDAHSGNDSSSSVAAAGGVGTRRTIDYGVQIARGLAAAHDRGIVHRDLKPENVFITSDGHIKILDFGLAKLTQIEPSLVGITEGPTKMVDTSPGTLLGTMGYMAPEQVRGQSVDHRADVFALGAILYEMLSGQKAFAGATAADTISAIIDKDPPELPSERRLPPGLVRIVDRCLEKNPAARFQSTRDLAFALESLSSHSEEGARSQAATGPSGRARGQRLIWALVAGVAVAAVALGAVRYLRPAPVETRAYRSTIVAPPNTSITFDIAGYAAAVLAVSPDGQRLSFLARAADGRVQLWVRPFDGISAQPLAGTEGASAPFWSPDSQFLGFFADGKLKKINVSGGPPLVLCDARASVPGGAGAGGTWNRDGVIVFGATQVGRLQRVSAAGGEPSPVTMIDSERGESFHAWPVFLPDGRHFLYLAVGSKTGSQFDPNGIFVGSLDNSERKLLVPGGSNVKYAEGFLTFVRGTTLMAQPFDAARLGVMGEAVPVAEQLFTGPNLGVVGAFSVSDTGVLAYETGATGAARSQLTWFDRSGRQLGTLGDPADYQQIRISPDGQRVAVTLPDPTTRNTDIWIYDVARGVRTRFTFDPSDDAFPVWSPDGSRIAFARRKALLEIYQKASSGAGMEEVVVSNNAANTISADWSPDGKFLSYTTFGSSTGADLFIAPLSGDPKPMPFLQTPFNEAIGQFSPDGRWIAYQSNESGRQEVYVAPFPGPGGKWQVSTAGGVGQRWRRDGKELFYVSNADNKLMAADVSGQGAAFEVRSVRALFEMKGRRTGNNISSFDASADGQRFLINIVTDQTPASSSITLVVNWPALLKK